MATTKKAPVEAGGEKRAAAGKRVKSFAPRKFEDHTIVDAGNKVVGHIRVKPSGILWSPRSGKDWYGVGLEEFTRFIEQHGKKQKK